MNEWICKDPIDVPVTKGPLPAAVCTVVSYQLLKVSFGTLKRYHTGLPEDHHIVSPLHKKRSIFNFYSPVFFNLLKESPLHTDSPLSDEWTFIGALESFPHSCFRLSSEPSVLKGREVCWFIWDFPISVLCVHMGKYSNNLFQSSGFHRTGLYLDNSLNLPLGFLFSSFTRNSNAEDSVCGPWAPLANIRAPAHLPPSADPPGERAGADHQVLDGVKAEGEAPERPHLNPDWIRTSFLHLDSVCSSFC